MDEMLDVLNEDGTDTGEARPRSVVHSTGLWHRTVHIYFYRKNNNNLEILCHLRAKTKDLHPNKWDTRFGGHVKAGDTVTTAVIKELQEEVGITVPIEALTVRPSEKKAHFPNNEYVTIYFYHFEGSLDSLTFKDGEVQKVAWMNSDEILTNMQQHPDQWGPSFENTKDIISELQDM